MGNLGRLATPSNGVRRRLLAIFAGRMGCERSGDLAVAEEKMWNGARARLCAVNGNGKKKEGVGRRLR
jgi:hypothetical protein